ncbi:hypothetical protein [Methylobacterium variabile]|uniref:hypothetical protein n=1 Tax=Methylobacterium variabile TaxID=298794 RepID=UPI00069EE13E|nr:hypothetical protein [Methylobacterium variabile]
MTVALAVHAAKTGRFSPWGWIIVMLPPLGGVAYVLVELLPELLGPPRGQKTQREVARRANPEKTYRILRDRLPDADTVAKRVRLAEECTAQVAGGLRAVRTRSFAGSNGDEPTFHVGRAKADLELGRAADALAGVDALKRREPDYESARGNMLYARALAGIGRTDEARARARAQASRRVGPRGRERAAPDLTRRPRLQRFAVVIGEATPFSDTQASPSWPSRLT